MNVNDWKLWKKLIHNLGEEITQDRNARPIQFLRKGSATGLHLKFQNFNDFEENAYAKMEPIFMVAYAQTTIQVNSLEESVNDGSHPQYYLQNLGT